jgi:hypothetical protein
MSNLRTSPLSALILKCSRHIAPRRLITERFDAFCRLGSTDVIFIFKLVYTRPERSFIKDLQAAGTILYVVQDFEEFKATYSKIKLTKNKDL